jgi:hypothetical protein
MKEQDMRRILTAFIMLAAAAPAAAQQHAGHQGGHEHQAGQFPPGWQGRVDRENQQLTDVRFMAMGSSYHVITGPHVILWNPELTGTGEYRASATFRLDRAPERREGFGFFVGGRDLDGPDQDYLYFLARHDGSYMIRHRAGDEVHTLADWTEHAAVNRPGADSPAANQLAIEARADEVRFLINGEVVQTLQRVPMLNTDGIVGLRVGHHMDVHVPELVVAPLSR